MKHILIFIVMSLLFIVTVKSATVDTVAIYSVAMQKEIKCVVIKPSAYNKKNLRFSTVYLLHGHQGSYSNWIIKVPELKSYADEYKILIVCPDGDNASWYFDSPVNSNMKYETYISTEVPQYIDSAYRTIANREHRAITGLSMGGHGALLIAWKHAEKFGAAGSMSGGLDLSDIKNKYGINKILGDTLSLKKYSVLEIIDTKPADSLSIIIDDGIDDTFIEGNRKLHQKLLSLKIQHEYIERPGKHSWDYWRLAVRYQLFFFKNFFEKPF